MNYHHNFSIISQKLPFYSVCELAWNVFFIYSKMSANQNPLFKGNAKSWIRHCIFVNYHVINICREQQAHVRDFVFNWQMLNV